MAPLWTPMGAPGNASWVEPYLESPWVAAAVLAPAFPSPMDHAAGQVWIRFAVACFGGAWAVVFAGIVLSGGVLTRAFCCLTARSQQRPSMGPLICLCLVTTALLAGGIGAYLLLGHRGVSILEGELERVVAQWKLLIREGEALDDAALGAASALRAAAPGCPAAAAPALQDISRHLDAARAALAAFSADLAGRLARLQYTLAGVQDMSRAVLLGLALPAAVVLSCCSALVCAVHRAHSGCCSGGVCCVCCVRGVGALLFAPAILFVSLVTAAEFGAGLATASFCRDVDRNIVTYVRHLATDVDAEVVRFYVSGGAGRSRPLDELRRAGAALDSARLLADAPAAANCSGELGVSPALAASAPALHAAELALLPESLYPRYDAAVRRGVCETLVSGLAWLVLCQFVVGVICLPAQAFMAHRLLERAAAWRASLNAKLAVT